MSAIMTTLNTFFTGALDWAGYVLDFITNNELALIFFALSLAYAGIGIVKRIVR